MNGPPFFMQELLRLTGDLKALFRSPGHACVNRCWPSCTKQSLRYWERA